MRPESFSPILRRTTGSVWAVYVQDLNKWQTLRFCGMHVTEEDANRQAVLFSEFAPVYVMEHQATRYWRDARDMPDVPESEAPAVNSA